MRCLGISILILFTLTANSQNRHFLVNVGTLYADSTLSVGIACKVYKGFVISSEYSTKYYTNEQSIKMGVGMISSYGYFLIKAGPILGSTLIDLGFEFGLAVEELKVSPIVGISFNRLVGPQVKIGLIF